MVNFLSGCINSKLSGNVKVQVSTGEAIRILEGKSAGERKVPDLCIREKMTGESRVRWVLEVGFSETYKELLEDVHAWLTGREPEIIYCVLVKITEDPRYHCPLRNISDEEVQRRGLKRAKMIRNTDFTSKQYGPVFCDGDQWVGEIREVFWELWRLNPGTGTPELVGDRELLIPKSNSSPRIRLDEFLSGLSFGEAQISPNWDQFRTILEDDIRLLAIDRYQDWYLNRGNGGDDRRSDLDFK